MEGQEEQGPALNLLCLTSIAFSVCLIHYFEVRDYGVGSQGPLSHLWVLPTESRLGKHCKASVMAYEAWNAFFMKMRAQPEGRIFPTVVFTELDYQMCEVGRASQGGRVFICNQPLGEC